MNIMKKKRRSAFTEQHKNKRQSWRYNNKNFYENTQNAHRGEHEILKGAYTFAFRISSTEADKYMSQKARGRRS